MDYIKQLGILGFGSRLKRVSDKILEDATKVYSNLGIDFEAKHFTIFHLLVNSEKPLTITEITNSLSFSHPAIIKLTNELIGKDLIKSEKSKNDGRSRYLSITDKGWEIYSIIEPVWSSFFEATKDLFEEIGLDMISVIEKLEKGVDKKNIGDRIIDHYRESELSLVEIIHLDNENRDHFKTLNCEWLERYFEVEEGDSIQLENPEDQIISRGGFVIFAKYRDRIVGTSALEKVDEHTYMISKMSVTENYQGRGIGYKLGEYLVDLVKSIGGKEIVLITDQKLNSAIALYRKLGFELSIAKGIDTTKYMRSKSCITMKLQL